MQSTLAKLALCRTPALGAHRYHCAACQTTATVYNSCGDRHCPTCAGARRADWLDSAAQLLLGNVTYYQVVFTLPDTLSLLTLGNRKPLFDLLFHSAWQALRQVLVDEHQFEPAAALVLHTWNQQLTPHVHVHAVVPGGGPALTGKPRWITSRRRSGPRLPGAYLVDADTLRATFRETYLAGLQRLHRRGELRLTGDWAHLQDVAAFDAFLQPLREIDWVTFLQPPPVSDDGQPASSPTHVLKYLARYLTGGPISDRRLLAHDNGKVTFLARTGKATGGSREQHPVTLSGIEFVRRWSQHILPKGCVKSRRYGGFSNRHRERYLADCRALLPPSPEPDTSAGDTSAESETLIAGEPDTNTADSPPMDAAGPTDRRAPACPACGNRMQRLTAEPRPSWRDIMASPHRPPWYARPPSPAPPHPR